MPAIAEVVRELTAADTPVIFLDTCDLLHIVRAIPRGLLRYPVAAVKLRNALCSTPPACRLVLSHLTPTEWKENLTSAEKETHDHLAKLDKMSTDFHDTREAIGIPITFTRAEYAGSRVPDELTELSRSLLSAALVIDPDDGCERRACARVYAKVPPSRKGGELKDCTILEQYLAVGRGLHAPATASRSSSAPRTPKIIAIRRPCTRRWPPNSLRSRSLSTRPSEARFKRR